MCGRRNGHAHFVSPQWGTQRPNQVGLVPPFLIHQQFTPNRVQTQICCQLISSSCATNDCAVLLCRPMEIFHCLEFWRVHPQCQGTKKKGGADLMPQKHDLWWRRADPRPHCTLWPNGNFPVVLSSGKCIFNAREWKEGGADLMPKEHNLWQKRANARRHCTLWPNGDFPFIWISGECIHNAREQKEGRADLTPKEHNIQQKRANARKHFCKRRKNEPEGCKTWPQLSLCGILQKDQWITEIQSAESGNKTHCITTEFEVWKVALVWWDNWLDGQTIANMFESLMWHWFANSETFKSAKSTPFISHLLSAIHFLPHGLHEVANQQHKLESHHNVPSNNPRFPFPLLVTVKEDSQAMHLTIKVPPNLTF